MLTTLFTSFLTFSLVLSGSGSDSQSRKSARSVSSPRQRAARCYELFIIYDSFNERLITNRTDEEREELLEEYRDTVIDFTILEEKFERTYIAPEDDPENTIDGEWNTAEEYLDVETGYFASLYGNPVDNTVAWENAFFGYFQNYEIYESDDDSVRLLVRANVVKENLGFIARIVTYEKLYPKCVLDDGDLKYVIRSSTSDPFSEIETAFDFNFRRLAEGSQQIERESIKFHRA